LEYDVRSKVNHPRKRFVVRYTGVAEARAGLRFLKALEGLRAGHVQEHSPVVKKIAIVAAVFVLILVLTRIANEIPPEPPSGNTFWLYAQQVVQCSPTQITLVDTHQTETLLEKDASWPDCSLFQKTDVLDFHLSRGEKTRYIGSAKTEWWRRAM
jgi:hypothetical protein